MNDNNSFIDIYIYEEGFPYEETELIPWRRRYIYGSNRNNEKPHPRIESLYVWRLLEVACRQSLGVELNTLNPRKEKTKKPVIDDYYISLSHDHGFYMVAISSHPIGVDIQEDRPSERLSIKSTCWTGEERNLLSENIRENVKYWCRKEALYKLIDPGTYFRTNEDIVQINTADPEWEGCFEDGRVSDYHYWSVVSKLIKEGIKPSVYYWRKDPDTDL